MPGLHDRPRLIPAGKTRDISSILSVAPFDVMGANVAFTQPIIARDVDEAIPQSSQRLAFSQKIEKRYETDTAADRRKFMIRQNWAGLVVYHSFLFMDYKTVADVFALDLFAHFAVMTPLMIVTNFLLSRAPRAWVREAIESASMVALAATIVWIVASSSLPDRDLVQWAMLLVVLFATVIQRLQFWYAVVVCVSTQIIYAYGLTWIGSITEERALVSNSVFMGTMVFSLIGAYNLEREHRVSYLLRLRETLRNRELEAISFRDALTGIGNRHALAKAIAELQEAAAREGSCQTLSIILLDIDRFKLFNDTNGHQKGDDCLRQVAQIVAGSLRSGDAVYRFGGEEFLVLLAGTTLNDASLLAERIRARVGKARLPRDGSGTTFVSISAGVSSGSVDGETSAEALITGADVALYAAKRDGRDRVWRIPSFDAAPLPIPLFDQIAS